MRRKTAFAVIVPVLLFALLSRSEAGIDFGVSVDYLVPMEENFEQGTGYDFYMKFDYNDYLSYGFMFRQLSISGEENDRAVVLDASEHLFSLWYEVFDLAYVRAAVGGSRMIVSTGSGANDARIVSEFGLGLQKTNKRDQLLSRLYTEVGYRLRPSSQDYFGSGNVVTDLGGIVGRVGIAIAF